MSVKTTAAGRRIRRGPSRAFTNTTKTPLNIRAMFSAVGIHAASSNPNPLAPRRSARPTPTSRAFRVASPAPRNTPAIPKYGLVYGAAGALLDSVAVGLTSDTDIRLLLQRAVVRTVATTDNPGRSLSSSV